MSITRFFQKFKILVSFILMMFAMCLMTINGLAATFNDIGNSRSMVNGFSTPVHHKRYGDLPAYLIEMKDGQLLPNTLVVPAKQRFRIIIRNLGSKPAEFESNQLRQEKVLYMGTESALIIQPLSQGSYDYFDDFTPGVKGKIIAK